MGDFQNLYPLRRGLLIDHDDKMEQYDIIMKKSREVYEENISGGQIRSKN